MGAQVGTGRGNRHARLRTRTKRVTQGDYERSEERHGSAWLVRTGVVDDPNIPSNAPMWFIDKSLRYKPIEWRPREYRAPAFGRLRFPHPESLPERRLFGARA